MRRPQLVRSVGFVLVLILQCACGNGQNSPSGSSANQVSEDELKSVLKSDQKLSNLNVKHFFSVLFNHHQIGWDLWQESKKLRSDSNVAATDALIRVATRSWIRPILIDTIENAMTERSAELQKSLSEGGGRLAYNVAVVGAGPNGSLAALKIHQTRPDLKIALLESAGLPSDVFRTFGNFTWINSPEFPQFSTNKFPGLPVAVKDLLEPGSVPGPGPFFIMPSVICDMNDLAAFLSGADLFFNSSIQRVLNSSSSVHALDVDLGSNRRLEVDKVLLATGFGREPFFGNNYPLPKTSPAPGDAPGIEHFDEVAVRASEKAQSNRLLPSGSRLSFMTPYVGKRIIIVGAGDAANNLAELASGYGHPEVYGVTQQGVLQPGRKYGPGIADPNGVAQVIWVHQKNNTPAEFLADKNTKPRYRNTIPQVYGAFTKNPNKVGSILRNRDALTGKDVYVLDLIDEHNRPAGHLVGDYVWFGTGYKLSSTQVLKNLPHGIASPSEADLRNYIEGLPVIRGTIDGIPAETQIGRKVDDNQYLAGTTAGQLATDFELKTYIFTKNSASLENNTRRSVALGEYVAKLPGYSAIGPTPVSEEAPPTHKQALQFESALGNQIGYRFQVDVSNVGLGRIFLETPEDPNQRKPYMEIAIKTLLARVLTQFAVMNDFVVRFETQGNALAVRTTLLSSDSLDRLVQAMKANPNLLKFIQTYSSSSTTGAKSTCIRVANGWRSGVSRYELTPHKFEVTQGCE